MMKTSLKSLVLVATSAVVLSACQTETVGQAASEAPKSAPMVAATPAATVAAPTGETLSGPVAVATGRWDKGRKGFALAAMATNIGGMTAVCGVRANIGTNSATQNAKVISGYGFYIGDTSFLRGASHFTLAKDTDDFDDTPANCRVSSKPWNPEYANGPWSLRYRGSRTF